MRVAYPSRRDVAMPIEGAVSRGTMSLDRLLNTSDVVSLHVPLTPRRRHLIDKRALDAHEAIGVSDQHGAGAGRRRGGAGVGARSSTDRRRGARRLRARAGGPSRTCSRSRTSLLVPHLGSATTETRTAMADLAADNVVAVLRGGRR